ncbi:MAG: alpha-E domain-containing protein [Gemmatimonadota bacterium]
MISRVADCCFWFGRYIERTEATARLMSVTRTLAMDAEMEPRQCWLPVIIVNGQEPAYLRRTAEHSMHDSTGDQVEEYMTWADDNLSSIQASVSAARENARQIREVISLEVWETINELYLWLESDAAQQEFRAARYSFYRRIRQGCQLVTGLLRSTMLHELPLNFIWLGMLLERGSQTARVLDVHHHALVLRERTHQVIETALWMSLLRACSAYEPFTKRNRGRVTGDAVADFLIFEPLFPKSITYCVCEALARFAVIRPPHEDGLPGGESQARLDALDAWLTGHAAIPEGGDIHQLLTHVVDEIAAICNGLSRELFGQVPVPASESAQ